MRSTQLACELLLLASTTYALPELQIAKRHKHGARPILQKRQSAIGTNVYDVLTWTTGGAYYANITVGTPAQQQVVILDTGSADLYFDASSAPQCQTSGAYSCRGGTFDPSASKSYTIIEPAPAFDTRFGDGSTASGPFAADTVCISDVCIDNVQFGVAQQVKSTTGYAVGLLGLGYSAIEATRHAYPNIPEVLTDAGVIASRLYSVYLNDEGATSGSILFGGIDTSKYTGSLQTLDILPDTQTNYIDEFITSVTALKASVGGQSKSIFSGGSAGSNAYQLSNSALPVLLDTGSAAWSVPQRTFRKILNAFPYVSSQGYVDCQHASSDDTLTLTFGNAIDITVPAKEFIVPLYNRTTNTGYTFQDGSASCIFMIAPSQGTGQGFDTLGDAILRSMYVVFDLDNGQVSIAQAAVNSTASPNIKVVSAGPNGVSKAVSGVKAPPSASASAAPIAPQINGTATFTAMTEKTTIGTATGVGAVPASARVSASGSSAADGRLTPVRGCGWEWVLPGCVMAMGLAGGMGLFIS